MELDRLLPDRRTEECRTCGKTMNARSGKKNSASSAARHGYVDAVIDPAETRKHLVYAFEMLFA